MKKVISLVLSSVLALGVLAGCAAKTPAPAPTTPAPTAPVATGFAKIGLGTITSIAKSKDVDVEKGATAQVDTVMLAAAFDKDGKIMDVLIDTAQTKVLFDKDMKLTSDVAAPIKTKQELGADYGMGKVSTLKKEWFEQANAIADYMVGKTVAEVKAIKLTEGVADDAAIKAFATIKLTDYIAAVEKAYANAVEVKAGAEKLGLGNKVTMAKSKSEDADKPAVAQVDTVIIVSAFDKDGKIAGATIDTAQTKVLYDIDGKLTSDLKATIKSKQELGADYGMGKVSTIKKEWFEQINAFAEYMVGKTVAEVKGLKLTEGVADDAAIKAFATIKLTDYMEVLEESAK
jgi:hypothetical protein